MLVLQPLQTIRRKVAASQRCFFPIGRGNGSRVSKIYTGAILGPLPIAMVRVECFNQIDIGGTEYKGPAGHPETSFTPRLVYVLAFR